MRAGANCKLMELVNLQISCGCTPGNEAGKGLHKGTFKIDSHKCFHLNYSYNSYIFKIYQKHYFYAVHKTKILKMYWLFSSKKAYNN